MYEFPGLLLPVVLNYNFWFQVRCYSKNVMILAKHMKFTRNKQFFSKFQEWYLQLLESYFQSNFQVTFENRDLPRVIRFVTWRLLQKLLESNFWELRYQRTIFWFLESPLADRGSQKLLESYLQVTIESPLVDRGSQKSLEIRISNFFEPRYSNCENSRLFETPCIVFRISELLQLSSYR